MRKIIVVITHLLFVSVLCVAQTQDTKGSSLFQEIFSQTQDIDKTELILTAIYQHKETNNVETLSAKGWQEMQSGVMKLETKRNRSTDEKEKASLQAKIEYMKRRYITLDTFLKRIYRSK